MSYMIGCGTGKTRYIYHVKDGKPFGFPLFPIYSEVMEAVADELIAMAHEHEHKIEIA